MRTQDAIAKAIRKEIKWYQAAEILGASPRQLRRLHRRWQRFGEKGLLDQRQRTPGPKRATAEEVETVRKLCSEKYFDFNIQHFDERMVELHGLRRGYTWTKGVLQQAGLAERAPKRGQHRRKRERRPMAGMMMHLDGSTHRWCGSEGPQMDLLAVMDDATSEVYALHLVEQESTGTCMAILREAIEKKGLFWELYTDRGSHFCSTPQAGGKPDKSVKTQLGRAMSQLDVRLILGHSPQARGRGGRMWETIQGRLPQELRVAGIATGAAAQNDLNEQFLPRLNKLVVVAAAEQPSAFAPADGVDLRRVFCATDERTVDNDNTVNYEKESLQIAKNRMRATLAGCRVAVERLPDGRLAVWYGKQLLGRCDANGCLWELPPTAKGIERGEQSQRSVGRMRPVDKSATYPQEQPAVDGEDDVGRCPPRPQPPPPLDGVTRGRTAPGLRPAQNRTFQ
ncbi:MAG: ISNCY family transposase [Deltaproteobacteria bacterium]|nr:ISNCY family transposase [Deltaproteobacteria bacterium]